MEFNNRRLERAAQASLGMSAETRVGLSSMPARGGPGDWAMNRGTGAGPVRAMHSGYTPIGVPGMRNQRPMGQGPQPLGSSMPIMGGLGQQPLPAQPQQPTVQHPRGVGPPAQLSATTTTGAAAAAPQLAPRQELPSSRSPNEWLSLAFPDRYGEPMAVVREVEEARKLAVKS